MDRLLLPSAMLMSFCMGDSMPRRRLKSRTLSVLSTSITRTVQTLRDIASALRMVMGPRYSLPKFPGFQIFSSLWSK